jgi:hypothetical protein
MACNCCTPGGCKCRVPKNDPNAEVPSFDTYPFSYNMGYKIAPWIHRKYPKPMSTLTWLPLISPGNSPQYIADNATFKENGDLYWAGDIGWQAQSRSGTPAGYGSVTSGLSGSVFSGYLVEDWDGDSSAWLGAPGGVNPAHVISIFSLEEKQDNVKRECQLWAKFTKATLFQDEENGLYYYNVQDWSEPEIIHSVKWDEPTGPMIIVDVPSKYFNGPDGVELRYFCTDPCGAETTDGTTWIINGQASYITESVIEFPLDYCKSYGKGETTTKVEYVDCGIASFTVINKSEKLFLSLYQSCGYQYGFGLSFFNPTVPGFCGVQPPEPCQDQYQNPYTCCGNTWGGYTQEADGTTSCSYFHSLPPGCYFQEDHYNRQLIDSKTVILNGIWTNYPDSWTLSYNCSTMKGTQDTSVEYKLGTVVVTGV